MAGSCKNRIFRKAWAEKWRLEMKFSEFPYERVDFEKVDGGI